MINVKELECPASLGYRYSRSTQASLSPGTQQTTSLDVYWKSPSILTHKEQFQQIWRVQIQQIWRGW